MLGVTPSVGLRFFHHAAVEYFVIAAWRREVLGSKIEIMAMMMGSGMWILQPMSSFFIQLVLDVQTSPT